MDEAHSCPVCGAAQTAAIGRHQFLPEPQKGRDSAYVRSRLDAVFSQWAPGAAELALTYVVCESCGFVWYQPRPTAAEIDAKYRFLGKARAPDGNRDLRMERLRAKELQKVIRPVAQTLPPGPSGHLRLLDFGGGDGRLVAGLSDTYSQIGVLDYVTQPVEGVHRLGATLEDLREEDCLEMIVASHVIEHVADPVGVLRRLRGHAVSGGAIYVEVPMEIWGRPPIHAEPATHVNFFVESSLEAAMRRSGWTVDRCWLGSAGHSAVGRITVVRAIGRNAEDAEAGVFQTSSKLVHGRLARTWPERWKHLRARPDRARDFALRALKLR